MKRISELTSTVNQQPCGIKDDHDIILQLEAQNHGQFEMIKDMCPEFQRLCAVHASSALAPENIRPPQAKGNWSQDGDYDSVDKGLFDYLYKGYEADLREPWSIHTDTVQYASDTRVHADLIVEDATKRNGQIRLKIEDLEYYPGVSNALMHGFRPRQTILATYIEMAK